ncbi:6004_t:CDS:2 [Funneliformis geosporum]|nr:6004_t:CDS:2 [Funneliformis geosporum]
MLTLQIDKVDYLLLQSILVKYPYHFYAYGSRAKGTARKFSDLDLCYQENIPSYKVIELEAELENSDLPFMVELTGLRISEAINFDLTFEHGETQYKNLYLLREQVKKEMNLPVNIELSPHTLRRCFATHQAISGMPLPVLQKVLGHSKVSTTALYIRDGDLGNLVKFRPV